jgi:hypothetical protein
MAGRKKIYKDNETTHISLRLYNDQLAWLDNLCVVIRKRHNVHINRAELIRSFIDAVAVSEIDLGELKCLEGICNSLIMKLKS